MQLRDVDVPFHDYLAFERRDDGAIVLPLGEHVRGAVVPLHGGILCTLLDVACGGAMWGEVPYDSTTTVPVSIRLDVSFIGQPRSGPLVATASIASQSAAEIEVHGQVADGGGYVIGRATGTYRLISNFGQRGD